MKRFYEEAAAEHLGKSWRVTLDGRTVKTPGARDLLVPFEGLAIALADEWGAQMEEIDPAAMPLTRLANTAIDRTASLRESVIEEVAGYGASDLLCYRVSDPAELVDRQSANWDPLLDWVGKHFSANLSVTTDITPLEQDNEALLAIYSAVARKNDFALTGLHATTGLCGSVVIGLALAETVLPAEKAWQCAILDEMYQAEQWGVDADAEQRWKAMRDEIAAATLFMDLSRD
jgi:chaperone required for assembly of F1-ATPase